MRYLLVAVITFLLFGCASSGTASHTERTYTVEKIEAGQVVSRESTVEKSTSVTTPKGAVDPGTLKVSDGSAQAMTGAAQSIDQAMASLSHGSLWLGGMLLLAGIASLAARWFAWIPSIPVNASIMLMASGAAVLAFPVLLDRYSLFILLGLAGVGGLYAWGWWDNKNKEQQEPA